MTTNDQNAPVPKIGREDYTERQEARRERLLTGAQKADARADAAFKGAHNVAKHIPLGQPILVGHHSERRHRRDVDTIARRMDRGVEETKKAERLRGIAFGVGTGGVSSDDPEALVKLREKLAELEEGRAIKKRANAAYRAAKKRPEVLDDGGKYGDLPASTRALLRTWEPPYSFVKSPFTLTNIGAKIRATQKRIKDMEALAAVGEWKPVHGDGWTISHAEEINRIRVDFDRRCTRDVCKLLRSCAFKWNRTEGAWTRMVTANAWSTVAYRLAPELRKLGADVLEPIGGAR